MPSFSNTALALVAFAAGFASSTSLPDPAIYDASKAITTELGCECKSACSTSAAFHCDAVPYCVVKSQHCARGDASFSFTNMDYYDYCVFPEYVPYESQTAAQKQALILDRIEQDTGSGSYPDTLHLAGVFTESVIVSFESQSDVFSQGDRTKYIHSVASVAPIKWVSNGNHPYTGLFAGADYGLVRFSSATAPSESAGFTPGGGFKFFRDGVASANFVAMPGLDAQSCSTPNFFAKNFSNHLPNPTQVDFAKSLLKRKFWQASYCPLMVGISDVASPLQGQNASAPPIAPFRLDLVPASGLSVDIPCGDYAGGLKNFAALAVGTTLFDVYATASPGAAQELIGSMVTTGAFTTSKFGDQQLFFKHQYMEDDWTEHPEWLEKIDKVTQCGMSCSGVDPPGKDKGCSSPFPSRRLGEQESSEEQEPGQRMIGMTLDTDAAIVGAGAA